MENLGMTIKRNNTYEASAEYLTARRLVKRAVKRAKRLNFQFVLGPYRTAESLRSMGYCAERFTC